MARVLVAMSGGVDSSVAAALLTRQGHETIGCTFNQWPKATMTASAGNGCCAPRTIDDARRVCRILDIPHYLVNYRREFESAVIEPWTTAYLQGETPNPCVMCNKHVRFGAFLTKADELGAAYIATGHYARVAHDPATERARLLRSRDGAKDQSYVLHVLGQRQLRRVLFPLGDLTKTEVRALAGEFGLPVANKPDSQEICFVPDDDYAAVVRRTGTTGPGDILDSDGRIVGRHEGLETVTVGQRRGLDLGGGAGRRYAVQLQPDRNAVLVGDRAQALARRVHVRELHWVADSPPPLPVRAGVKTRYHMPDAAALIRTSGPGTASVTFETPTWAPAPGQYAVMYAGDEVLGGGPIARVEAA